MKFLLKEEYRKRIFFIGIIMGVALLLRLYCLGSYSFWYDEASCVVDERGLGQIHSISKLLDGEYLLQNQDYLALYNHMVIYYWQKLVGKSEFLLRLSSVFFSLLSICMLYILGKHIFNIKTARIAGILLAVSPFHIYYAQELRPYAAVCFLTMLSVFLFIRALETGKKRYWTGFVFSSVLSVYFHCMSLLVLFSFCLFFAFNIKKYKSSLKPFALSCIAAIFLLIPAFLTLYPNIQFIWQKEVCSRVCEFPVWSGKPALKHLLVTLKCFSVGYNINYYSFGGRLISILSFFLFLFGASKFYKKSDGKLLLTVLFVPIILLFFISRIQPSYVIRYFFSIFPLYVLGIAAGLERLNKKYLFIFLCIIIGFSCFGLKNYYANFYPQDPKTQHIGIAKKLDIREMTRFIAENYVKGDIVIHTCKNTVFPLRFYIRQVSNKSDLIKEVDMGKVFFITDFIEEKSPILVEVNYKELHPATFLPAEFKIVKNLTRKNRLWVIFSSWDFKAEDSEEYAVIKELRETFRLSKLKKFEGFFLYMFN